MSSEGGDSRKTVDTIFNASTAVAFIATVIAVLATFANSPIWFSVSAVAAEVAAFATMLLSAHFRSMPQLFAVAAALSLLVMYLLGGVFWLAICLTLVAALALAYYRKMLLVFAVLAVAIICINVLFRSPLLQFYGFYEPDGYYHYTMIETAIRNGFQIPPYSPLSGWPPSCSSPNYPPCGTNYAHGEALGLYWVTLIPYFFLRFAGVSAYNLMRLIPLLYGVLDGLLAYLLVRYWSKDRFLGLLVMLFVALNMGNAARTSALIYRGDSFVTTFLLGALITTVAIFKIKSRNRKLALAASSALLLSLCNLVWNGAPFATATYMLAFILLLILGFAYERRDMIENSGYMLLALGVWFIFVNLFRAAGLVLSPQTFTGSSFFIVFVPLVAGWALADYATLKTREMRIPYLGTPASRLAVSMVAIAVIFVAIYLFIPHVVDEIFVTNGFYITSAFASTIQELQAPSYSFLFASFNFQNFTNPMGLVMLVATYFSSAWIVPFWLVLLAFSLTYLFMQVHHEEHMHHALLGGKHSWKFEVNEAVVVLIAYFALTAYLQMNAIRFNSLISVPLSIFGAFTLYWLVLFIRDRKPVFNMTYASLIGTVMILYFAATIKSAVSSGSIPIALLLFEIAGAVAVSVFIASVLYQIFSSIIYGDKLSIALLAIAAMAGSYALLPAGFMFVALALLATAILSFGAYSTMRRWQHVNSAYYLSLAAIAFLVLILVYTDIGYTQSLYPADEVTPQFIQAMAWMRNNTAVNSVALTLWPDGSLVEGVANRTTVTDSVGSQFAYKGDPFAAWLLNSSTDPRFLLANITGAPDYLIARQAWMYEIGGIYTEANISTNESNFGYDQFNSLNEKTNSTAQLYEFFGSNLQVDTQITNTSKGRVVSSYIVQNTGIIPFASVEFYNVLDGNWSIVNQTLFNQTNGDTFVIMYSQVPAPNLYVNITGAYIFSPDLQNSNMVKFLYQCGYVACTWNNKVASLQLVFANQDTKIFHISYNASNSTVAAALSRFPRK